MALRVVAEVDDEQAAGPSWAQRVVTGLLLALLAPVLAVLAVATRLAVGTPITVGSAGAVRFRTDVSPTAGRGAHWVGIQMRRWHVDQLPLLWSVVRGVRPTVSAAEPRWAPPAALDHSAG